MRVRYIFHSGFLVETESAYYLFDYYRGALPKLDTAKPITVFSSHAHSDHYNAAVFADLTAMGMQRVFAVLAKDIPKKRYPADIEALCVRAQETYSLPNGETLLTLRSTDSGVAFLLTTPEGVLYHAGDLNDWTWEGESESENRMMRGNYRHEIDRLADVPIDVAFVPLDPRQGAHYADGMLYFLTHVRAKCVYPMHYWEQPEVIERFLTENPRYIGTVQHTENILEGVQPCSLL